MSNNGQRIFKDDPYELIRPTLKNIADISAQLIKEYPKLKHPGIEPVPRKGVNKMQEKQGPRKTEEDEV